MLYFDIPGSDFGDGSDSDDGSGSEVGVFEFLLIDVLLIN